MSAKVVEKPKGSGKWGVRICKNGLEKYKRTPTRAEAERQAKLINVQIARVDLGLAPPVKKSAPTLIHYAALWLETYIKPPMRSVGTYARYRGLLENYLLPAMGRRHIDEFKRATIRDGLLAIYHGDNKPSQSLIEGMIAVLSGIFGMALDSEMISVNPVSEIGRSLRLPKEQKKEILPFTGDESEAILTVLEKRYPDTYPLFLTLFTTGMRLGEACGLQWGDINFHTRQIRVQRTATHQTVHDTKTNSARMVDMSNGLTDVLTSLKEEADGEEKKTGEERPFCFHQDGRLQAQRTLLRYFSKAQAEAGINRRRIHDIRHTYASRLLSAGESIVYVSRQLGHKNIQMTVDVYTHWIPSGEGRPANMLDRPDKPKTS